MMRNRIAITAPGAGAKSSETLTMTTDVRVRTILTCVTGRGAGRRSLGDRLGSSGDGDTERDEEVVNKSVMSRVVKVRLRTAAVWRLLLFFALCRRSSPERKPSRNRRQTRSPLQEIRGCSELLSELCRDSIRKKSRRRMSPKSKRKS